MGKRVSFTDVVGDDDGLDVADLSQLPPRVLPVAQLIGNPDNPRGPKDSDLKELADTLREHGQLQPITVVSRDVFLKHFPEHTEILDGAGWVVVNGNRRLAAARIAGLETLEVSVRDALGEEEGRIDEAVMIENIHRRNLEPLREAEFLRRMVDRPGGSLRTVAKKIGKSHVYVKQRVSLLQLVPELKDALRADELGVKEARELALLPPNEQLGTWEKTRQAPETPTEQGGNRVNTSRKTSAVQRAIPRVRLTTPHEVASALRAHFSDEDLAELAELISTR